MIVCGTYLNCPSLWEHCAAGCKVSWQGWQQKRDYNSHWRTEISNHDRLSVEGDGPQAAQFEVHDDPGDDFFLAPEDDIQGADISEREAPREGQQVEKLRSWCAQQAMMKWLWTVSRRLQTHMGSQFLGVRWSVLGASCNIRGTGAANNYSCCSGCLEFWNQDSKGASTSRTSQWNPSRALQSFFGPFLHEVGESSTDPDAVISLALVDSRTSFLGCVPMNGKAQFDLQQKRW